MYLPHVLSVSFVVCDIFKKTCNINFPKACQGNSLLSLFVCFLTLIFRLCTSDNTVLKTLIKTGKRKKTSKKNNYTTKVVKTSLLFPQQALPLCAY